jgi:hypothetical protein
MYLELMNFMMVTAGHTQSQLPMLYENESLPRQNPLRQNRIVPERLIPTLL